jgi:hypothetical protein
MQDDGVRDATQRLGPPELNLGRPARDRERRRASPIAQLEVRRMLRRDALRRFRPDGLARLDVQFGPPDPSGLGEFADEFCLGTTSTVVGPEHVAGMAYLHSCAIVEHRYQVVEDAFLRGVVEQIEVRHRDDSRAVNRRS